MNDIFLNSSARFVYDSVFIPLSDQLDEISEMKRQDVYHRPPYVKLQTKNEGDLQSVKVFPYIIRHDSYLSPVYKVYAGARNYASNSVNSSGATGWLSDWSFGYIDPWNCNREKTSEALRTALAAFRPFIIQMNEQLARDNSPELLDLLEREIAQLQQTVERAKKTIYYIYRTYDHGAAELEKGEVLQGQGNGPECIYKQYEALCCLLDDLCLLQERVAEKRALIFSQPQLIVPIKCRSPHESSLQFASREAASLWFCNRRLHHRQRVCHDDETSLERLGDQSYADLMHAHRLAQRVPEPFIKFAKSIDREIAKVCGRDEIRSSQFVGEVYTRWEENLKEKGLQTSISVRPDHFNMWFKQLCVNKAPRHFYKAVFAALMNFEGNGPYRLDCAPSALSAIMQSDYFSMFESCSNSLNFSR